MDTWNWVSLGIAVLGGAWTVNKIYVRQEIKNKEHDMKLDALKDAFHEHELTNEKAFDKWDKTVDQIFKKFDELKDLILKRNDNRELHP